MTMSVEARSNRSARARSDSRGRSLKVKSIVLTHGRLFRADLLQRSHRILGLFRIEAVDDVGDAGAALSPGR